MTITNPVLTVQNIADLTAYVNHYRALNQAPPLTYLDSIAGVSQNWSYNMCMTNNFHHSGSQLYGENLAYLRGYGTDPVALIKTSIDLWYQEISLYDFNKPGFSEATGHFTCLVWKSTTNMGLGISMNTSTGEAYITMNTVPPGNVDGEYVANVLPLVNPTPVPVPVPTPVPVPVPTPVPVPVPVPVPTPVPVPVPQNLVLINRLNQIIHQLYSHYPPQYIIMEINQIIQSLRYTD